MSTVVHKITMNLLDSVHTPDYSEKDYWINPVIPECDQKYWKNKDGKLSSMTSAEKKVIDNQEKVLLDVAKAEVIIRDNTRALAIQKGVDDGVLKADGSLK